MIQEMEMPTQCVHCADWFDLLDGYGSEKWHKDTIICENCFREEEQEIEFDNKVEELKEEIEECNEMISSYTENKKEYQKELDELLKIKK